jgi:hypothetical protein
LQCGPWYSNTHVTSVSSDLGATHVRTAAAADLTWRVAFPPAARLGVHVTRTAENVVRVGVFFARKIFPGVGSLNGESQSYGSQHRRNLLDAKLVRVWEGCALGLQERRVLFLRTCYALESRRRR